MRILIFSADIGEGHDLPARMLRDAIVARRPEAEVTILDALDAAGPAARGLVRSGSDVILGRMKWLYDLEYWLLTRFALTRRLASRLASLLARRGLARAIAAHRPAVVVSTYPGSTEVLGRMRRSGELVVPLVSAITDLAALRFWAHPGCDLHLVIHPESAEEIRELAGAGARITAVRGLTSPEFEHPGDPAAARMALRLPPDVPVVAVSGGGWGVGDLLGAVRAGLQAAPDVHVVALCGRNERVRARISDACSGESRVLVLGFTDRMSEILAAADVLVHSTAGLTVFEALVRGARVISYGWGVGHIRLNNRAYTRWGLADVVSEPDALTAAIGRALAAPRRPDAAYGELPSAAELVLALPGG